MGQQSNQLQRALLDIGEEMALRRGEQRPYSVCRNLLLNSNSAVDVQHFVKVNIFNLNLEIAVYVGLIDDGYSIGGRGSGSERSSSLWVRDFSR